MKIIFLIFLLSILLLIIKNYKKENFNNKNKYYLIANNPKITPNEILKLSKLSNNVLVFFNHIEPFKKFSISELIKLKNSKSQKKLFLRSNHLNSYWGKEEFDNQKIKIFNINNTNIILSDNTKNLKNPLRLNVINYKKYINDYPKKKQPQTGFVTFHYLNSFTNKYNIILYGFSRKKGQDDGDWCHEKNYELDYYKKNNVNIINL